jgi:hypothetical protein
MGKHSKKKAERPPTGDAGKDVKSAPQPKAQTAQTAEKKKKKNEEKKTMNPQVSPPLSLSLSVSQRRKLKQC